MRSIPAPPPAAPPQAAGLPDGPRARPGTRLRLVPQGRARSRVRALGRLVLRAMTVLAGVATAAITLGPRGWVVDGVAAAGDWLRFHPAQDRLVAALGGVEPAGNLLLFVPLAALLALAVPLRRLPVALVVLVCLPLSVEWLQQVLPGRVPDGMDVLRNTAGLLSAFVGVALLRAMHRLAGRVALETVD